MLCTCETQQTGILKQPRLSDRQRPLMWDFSVYTPNDGVSELVSTSTCQASGISRELLRQHLVLLMFSIDRHLFLLSNRSCVVWQWFLGA